MHARPLSLAGRSTSEYEFGARLSCDSIAPLERPSCYVQTFEAVNAPGPITADQPYAYDEGFIVGVRSAFGLLIVIAISPSKKIARTMQNQCQLFAGQHARIPQQHNEFTNSLCGRNRTALNLLIRKLPNKNVAHLLLSRCV